MTTMTPEVQTAPAPAAHTPGLNGHLDLATPGLYINPEWSLLEFQQRVLEEAQDTRNPLLERVRFISILASNLDEFLWCAWAG